MRRRSPKREKLPTIFSVEDHGFGELQRLNALLLLLPNVKLSTCIEFFDYARKILTNEELKGLELELELTGHEEPGDKRFARLGERFPDKAKKQLGRLDLIALLEKCLPFLTKKRWSNLQEKAHRSSAPLRSAWMRSLKRFF